MEIECYICANFGWKNCPEGNGGGIMYEEDMEEDMEFLEAMYGQ